MDPERARCLHLAGVVRGGGVDAGVPAWGEGESCMREGRDEAGTGEGC